MKHALMKPAEIKKIAVIFLSSFALLLGLLIWNDARFEKIEESIAQSQVNQQSTIVDLRKRFFVNTKCLDRGTETLGCYKKYYSNFVTTYGVEAAFEDLKIRYAGSFFIQGQCHQLTHEIGHAATILYDTPGEAFIHGDPFCWSGYYHGVMEKIVEHVGKEALPKKIASVCDNIPGKKTQSFDYYNCVHGLGHGVMTLLDNKLFDSLALCKQIPGAWEQESCSGGVFMENVMVESRGDISEYFKKSDPLYPCDAVADEFKSQCFIMQTSHMLFVSDNDFKTVFNLCASAEKPYRALCYQGIGREVSGKTVSNAGATKTLCSLGSDEEQRIECISGAVKDFISYFHSDIQAKKLCDMFSGNEKTSCRSTAESYYKIF